MNHQDFTPLPALAGGALIGLSASLLLLTHGKIAGISGILGGLLARDDGERGTRLSFVVGLLAAGVVLLVARPASFPSTPGAPLAVLALAGLLVGFGTRLGSGCTSGHGVCGVSRLSPRSLVATATFIAAGIATVWVTRSLGGAR